MWQEVISRNLFEEVKQLERPVYLLLGRHDWVTASSVAQDWLDGITAPAGKIAYWFENSGHWPHLEENRKFITILNEIISLQG